MSDYLQHIVGKRIYFDVNLFIYALEPTQNMQAYFTTVTKLFEMAVAKQIIAITSELTLAEALVGRIQKRFATSRFIRRND